MTARTYLIRTERAKALEALLRFYGFEYSIEPAKVCSHIRRKPSDDEVSLWQCADCGAYL